MALLGDGEYALHELKELLPITGPVTVCTNGLSPSVEFPPEVTVCREPIRRLVGEERLEAVEFSDGSILPVEALFVALGTAKGSDLARKLGIRLEDNRIVVKTDGHPASRSLRRRRLHRGNLSDFHRRG